MKRFTFVIAVIVGGLIAQVESAEPPIQSGDRIAIVGNTFADQLRVHGYLETLLLQYNKNHPVSIRNLGWGGDMLSARDRPTGFPSEQATLMAHKTDVIIACFGMGESFAGEVGLDDFQNELRAFIDSHTGKRYNGNSDVRLVLVSPIAYEDLGKRTPQHEKRNRDLAAYTNAMRVVADEAKVPFVDLFETSRYLMDEPQGPSLTFNGIHLNQFGYWAISHTFFHQLVDSDVAFKQANWTLRFDAATASFETRGITIVDWASIESGIQLQVAETDPPRLRPPTNQPLPPQLDFVRDRMIVDNLKPGNYRLWIDGHPIVTATSEEWADGVPIDSSPAHKLGEAYRAVINDKNLQFTYSWKALNQVHIVGERRKSPSGTSLPQEVIEFNELANKLDKTLSKPIELKTRQWRLMRVFN